MFKKCKVLLLPTKEKAKVNMINLAPYNREGQKLELIHYVTNGDGLNPQHLYFLSDDKIEESDWCICIGADYNHGLSIEEHNPKILKYTGEELGVSKIIATTDASLTTDSSDAKYKYLHYLPQPSQGFIKVFIEEYNKGNVITEVMVQYIKGEYVDGIVDCGADDLWDSGYYKSDILKVDTKDNTITIKKLKDSWNKCEHAANLIKYRQDYEQFKKDSHFGPNQREIEEWSNKWIEENL